MSKATYAPDKPSDCHNCYFWSNRKGCSLGGDNCYYPLRVPEENPTECDGCPYGRDQPCIVLHKTVIFDGFCII